MDKHKIKYFLSERFPGYIIEAILIPRKGASNLPRWWATDLRIDYCPEDETFTTISFTGVDKTLVIPENVAKELGEGEVTGINGFVGRDYIVYLGSIPGLPRYDVMHPCSFEGNGMKECDKNGNLLKR